MFVQYRVPKVGTSRKLFIEITEITVISANFIGIFEFFVFAVAPSRRFSFLTSFFCHDTVLLQSD